jgi:hypothetical protein
MFNSAVSMRELELESVQLLPRRETLMVMRFHAAHGDGGGGCGDSYNYDNGCGNSYDSGCGNSYDSGCSDSYDSGCSDSYSYDDYDDCY